MATEAEAVDTSKDAPSSRGGTPTFQRWKLVLLSFGVIGTFIGGTVTSGSLASGLGSGVAGAAVFAVVIRLTTASSRKDGEPTPKFVSDRSFKWSALLAGFVAMFAGLGGVSYVTGTFLLLFPTLLVLMKLGETVI